MGTLFQTLYASDALSLRIFGHMGFDVYYVWKSRI